jgi:hypothetical protein
MPVITRSQHKKMTADATKSAWMPVVTRLEQRRLGQSPVTISDFSDSEWHLVSEAEFARDIKRLLNDIVLAPCMTTKMLISLQIYNRINGEFEKLLQVNFPRWVKFAATVYNKTSEFEAQRETYHVVGATLVATFTKSYQKARQFLSSFFKNVRATKSSLIDITQSPYAEMYKNIDLCDFKATQCSRPRRNVPVVDYTGMDTIEPESKYDGITNIWYDESVFYDSDYNPDDDE